MRYARTLLRPEPPIETRRNAPPRGAGLTVVQDLLGPRELALSVLVPKPRH